eukprot:8475066-Pyramimonas_sp.AAC.1
MIKSTRQLLCAGERAEGDADPERELPGASDAHARAVREHASQGGEPAKEQAQPGRVHTGVGGHRRRRGRVLCSFLDAAGHAGGK